jgi:N-acyl-D-aspartate/D-glutamate deacylase
MFDVVIRGGTVFDGRGSAGTVADVAIADGTVVEIGRVTDRARQTIDAAGRFVAPGFIDGHTHLDAQIFWDPYAGSLTEHGVTSAVMGNCGFTLALALDHLRAVPGRGRGAAQGPERRRAMRSFGGPGVGHGRTRVHRHRRRR